MAASPSSCASNPSLLPHPLRERSCAHPLLFLGSDLRSIDLGFFKDSEEMYEDHSHFVRNSKLAWNIFLFDRLLALSTGRPCLIQEESIELPLPPETERGTPSSTGWAVRLSVLMGRIACVRRRPLPSSPSTCI